MDEHDYQKQSGITHADYSETGFWKKCRKTATKMGRPLLHKALCLYYLCKEESTPLKVKTAIYAALAYLISPFDVMLDLVPIVGFLDDIAVIAFAWSLAEDYITDEIIAKADIKLQEFI